MKNNIDKIISKYESRDYKNLIKYVYDNYPQYTIFSEINKQKNYVRDKTGIVTIGYQGKSIDQFFHILINEKIHSLIDIILRDIFNKSNLISITREI